MNSFAKGIISTIATTAIVSGIVYAAAISSVATQTIGSGDTLGAGWFQAVNDHVNGGSGMPSVDVYQCPIGKTPGANPGGGAWGYYGCDGGIKTTATCSNTEYPWTEARSCTYLGKLSVH